MKNKRLFLTILILFILAASGSIFVFSIDKWHIEIDCGKENDIKTNYNPISILFLTDYSPAQLQRLYTSFIIGKIAKKIKPDYYIK